MSLAPNPQITVVIPVYNEGVGLRRTYAALEAALAERIRFWEVIFVDDGSTDDSGVVLRELTAIHNNVRLISLSRNFGHQAAVTAGLDAALGEAVVIMDADLQDPPAVIHDLWKKWQEGYEVVYAIRRERKESWWLRFLYASFYRLLNRLSYIHIPEDSGDFALLDQKVVAVLRQLPERNRFVRGQRSWVGFRQVGVPYERAARAYGESKYTWRKLMKLAYDGLLSFSFAPLRLLTWLGVVVFAVATLSIVVVLYFRLFTNQSVPGFASLAIIALFLGGTQMLALGIVGEYLARIFDEVKARPRYVVREKINF